MFRALVGIYPYNARKRLKFEFLILGIDLYHFSIKSGLLWLLCVCGYMSTCFRCACRQERNETPGAADGLRKACGSLADFCPGFSFDLPFLRSFCLYMPFCAYITLSVPFCSFRGYLYLSVLFCALIGFLWLSAAIIKSFCCFSVFCVIYNNCLQDIPQISDRSVWTIFP